MRNCGLLFAALTMAAGIAWTGSSDAPLRKDKEPVREELQCLERLANDPQPEAGKVWRGVVQLQQLDPETLVAVPARQLLSQVRSPLDRLDLTQIPEGDRFPWQPTGLVAVLGEHARRHWGDDAGAAFSPDGKWVVSTSQDGVRLFEAATMREKVWLKDNELFAFAPDGKTLAVGEGKGIERKGIRLYDLAGGRLKRGVLLSKKDHMLMSLSFAPKGRVLMAGYLERRTRETPGFLRGKEWVFVLWEWGKDGVKGEELPRKPSADLRGAFSGDGKLFAHGDASRSLYVWGVTNEDPGMRAKLEGIGSYAFSPDRKALVTMGAKGMTVWDLGTGKPQKTGTIPSHGYVGGLTFSPDGRLIAGLDEKRLKLWSGTDVQTCLTGKKPRGAMRQFQLPCKPRTLHFSPDGRQLVLGSKDGSVRLWEIAKGLELFPPVGHCGQVRAAFSPDGTTLATVSVGDRTVRLWDLGRAKPQQSVIHTFPEGDLVPDQVVFSPGGDRLATFNWGNGGVRLWRWRHGILTPLAPIRPPGSMYVECVQFSPRGDHLLLAGSREGKGDGLRLSWESWVSVWRVFPDGKPSKEEGSFSLSYHNEDSRSATVRAAAFSADGRRLALVSRWSIYLWQWRPQRKQLAVLNTSEADLRGVALSMDGSEVVTAGTKLVAKPKMHWLVGLQFWGLKEGRLKPQGAHLEEQQQAFPNQVAFALDGKAVLISSGHGNYALFDHNKDRIVWDWKPPGSDYLSFLPFALAPDGRHVALCNANGTIYIVRLKEASKPRSK